MCARPLCSGPGQGRRACVKCASITNVYSMPYWNLRRSLLNRVDQPWAVRPASIFSNLRLNAHRWRRRLLNAIWAGHLSQTERIVSTRFKRHSHFMRIRITGTERRRVFYRWRRRVRAAHSRLAECGHARQLFDVKHILRITFTPHTIAASSPLYCSIYSRRAEFVSAQ